MACQNLLIFVAARIWQSESESRSEFPFRMKRLVAKRNHSNQSVNFGIRWILMESIKMSKSISELTYESIPKRNYNANRLFIKQIIIDSSYDCLMKQRKHSFEDPCEYHIKDSESKSDGSLFITIKYDHIRIICICRENYSGFLVLYSSLYILMENTAQKHLCNIMYTETENKCSALS